LHKIQSKAIVLSANAGSPKKHKSIAAFMLLVATSSEEYYQENPKTEDMLFCI